MEIYVHRFTMRQHNLKENAGARKGRILLREKGFFAFLDVFPLFLDVFLKYFSHFFTVFRQEKYTETNTSGLKSADFEKLVIICK